MRLTSITLSSPDQLGAERALSELTLASVPAAGDGASWVTVIIGKNGMGKSRLLGGVCALFEGVDRGRVPIRRNPLNVFSVRYSTESGECELSADPKGSLFGHVNNVESVPANTPLPARVIAVTSTALDKFPLTRRFPGGPPGAPGIYRYMGLRDQTGRVSAPSAVFRALDGLFDAAQTVERKSRIAGVFEFLGYSPRIEVTYRWRRHGYLGEGLEEILQEAKSDKEGDPRQSSRMSAIRRVIHNDPSAVGRIRAIVEDAARKSGDGQLLTLSADFSEFGQSDSALFRDLQFLRKVDLISIAAVELSRPNDGRTIDLQSASSGELSIVTTFLGLASAIDDNSLILVDEPEVSLHPEWQTRYVELLTRTFASYRGCHYIIATHSPLILSDIDPDRSNVLSLDDKYPSSDLSSEFAGQSADFLLMTAFDVPGNNNLYLKQLLVESLRIAADGGIASARFEEVFAPLRSVYEKLALDAPVRGLISQLMDARVSQAGPRD